MTAGSYPPPDGVAGTESVMGTEPVGSRWLSETLARMPLPDAPISQPWELSVSMFLRPSLPKILQRRAHLFDRLGLVRVSPSSITFESSDEVAWRSVLELRTRSLLDLFGATTVDKASSYAVRLLPPIPGVTKRFTRWICGKFADLLLTLLIVAARGHGDRAASVQVPAEIVYKSLFGRRKTMTAGLFSAAVLSLPAVTRSVLSTAQAHGIKIISEPVTRNADSHLHRAAVLQERMKSATERVHRLRRDAMPPSPVDSHHDDQELR